MTIPCSVLLEKVTKARKAAKVLRISKTNMKTKFNKECFRFIKPLLEKQPYITRVEQYNGEPIDYSLDWPEWSIGKEIETIFSPTYQLASLYFREYNVPVENTESLKYFKNISGIFTISC